MIVQKIVLSRDVVFHGGDKADATFWAHDIITVKKNFLPIRLDFCSWLPKVVKASNNSSSIALGVESTVSGLWFPLIISHKYHMS